VKIQWRDVWIGALMTAIFFASTLETLLR